MWAPCRPKTRKERNLDSRCTKAPSYSPDGTTDLLVSAGVASMNDDRFRWDFGPVPADEIAFAMSLFLAAAQRKILPKKRPTTEAELSNGQEAQRVFVSLVPLRPVPFPKAAEFSERTHHRSSGAHNLAGDNR